MNTEIINNPNPLNSKPHLLVIHGWAMNSSIWDSIREPLETQYQIIWLDLPGHGKSKVLVGADLEGWVDFVQASINQPCHILGWSLGGLVAQRLTQRSPHLVLSLCLVAISPSFIQRDNWLAAVNPNVLQSFESNLLIDYEETIRRFVALQFMGVKGLRAKFNPWLNNLISKPPELEALSQGLNLLAETDARGFKLGCPILWVLGERDKLVPIAVAPALLALGDNHQVSEIKGAGHAPFLSHADEFLQLVNSFISKVGRNGKK